MSKTLLTIFKKPLPLSTILWPGDTSSLAFCARGCDIRLSYYLKTLSPSLKRFRKLKICI